MNRGDATVAARSCAHCLWRVWRRHASVPVQCCIKQPKDGEPGPIPDERRKALEAGTATCEMFRSREAVALKETAPARRAETARPHPRQTTPGCPWRRKDRARDTCVCAITGTTVEPDCASAELELCAPRLALRLRLGTLQATDMPLQLRSRVQDVAQGLDGLERIGVRALTAAQRRQLDRARQRAERMRQDILRRVHLLEGLRDAIAALAEGRGGNG